MAVEKWSDPVKIDSFSIRYKWEDSPCLTPSLDTIFLCKGDGNYTSFFKNNKWQTPIKLNNFINEGPTRNVSISKDGKRLYFSKFAGYGSWDIWCSVKDTVTNDWGPAYNLGPNVNTDGMDFYAYELSPDTLYVINDVWAMQGVCIYIKDKISNSWKITDSSNYKHPFGKGRIRGLSITADKRKVYFGYYEFLFENEHLSDLYVSYWDTLNNRWGNTYRLNINSNGFKYLYAWNGGNDEYPWIAPDGKTLFFCSNRDASREDSSDFTTDIYMSKLLFDENGNPVTSVKNTTLNRLEFNLFQNYPNPFNPVTNIKYFLPEYGCVKLKVYDLLGREVLTLINEEKPSGNYSVEFNGSKFPSGVYYYKLEIAGQSIVKKLILLK